MIAINAISTGALAVRAYVRSVIFVEGVQPQTPGDHTKRLFEFVNAPWPKDRLYSYTGYHLLVLHSFISALLPRALAPISPAIVQPGRGAASFSSVRLLIRAPFLLCLGTFTGAAFGELNTLRVVVTSSTPSPRLATPPPMLDHTPHASPHESAVGDSRVTKTATHADGRPERHNELTMRMWSVSVPFKVVCVMDRVDEEAPPRQQALLAVDFGHVVWLKYVCAADDGENTTSHMSAERSDFGLSRFPG